MERNDNFLKKMAAQVDHSSKITNIQPYIHKALAKIHIKYRHNKVQQIRTDAEGLLNKHEMPYLKYHLLDIKNIHFMWITDGNKQLHRITDPGKFYGLLGYTEEMRQSCIDPEVFVWEHYRKDNCLKAEVCLQANIIDYLNINSAKFQNEYTIQYTNWRGSCKSDKLRDTADCTDCKMHPLNKLEK